MTTAEVVRRSVLFVSAALILSLILFYGSGPRSSVPDTLPAQLSNEEFWQMVTDFSEPSGYFRSENLLSNEAAYQTVIPDLRKALPRGGVYMGVGPEQNFTYIVALEPKMAFVVDIRRQNMLEHLLYKALMETCADRVEFLSRLFARPRNSGVDSKSTAGTLMRAYETEQGSQELFDKNVQGVLDYLVQKKGFKLSTEDREAITHVAQEFFRSGPDLSYSFVGGYGGFMGMPTYSDLMTESDGVSRNWNFLATEDQFRAVQNLQKNNLIVPLVGDFAGPKAIRALARYLGQHGSVVRAFYTSNVEQYLFQDEDNWKRFYENVSVLPTDSNSTFIRYVLNGWGFRRRQRSLTAPIDYILNAYRGGRIHAYYDVVNLSR
jgi:hypothetical protein